MNQLQYEEKLYTGGFIHQLTYVTLALWIRSSEFCTHKNESVRSKHIPPVWNLHVNSLFYKWFAHKMFLDLVSKNGSKEAITSVQINGSK